MFADLRDEIISERDELLLERDKLRARIKKALELLKRNKHRGWLNPHIERMIRDALEGNDA